jgi:hypothetical protein
VSDDVTENHSLDKCEAVSIASDIAGVITRLINYNAGIPDNNSQFVGFIDLPFPSQIYLHYKPFCHGQNLATLPKSQSNTGEIHFEADFKVIS